MAKFDKFKDVIPTYQEDLDGLKEKYVVKGMKELMPIFAELKAKKVKAEEEAKDAGKHLVAISELMVALMESESVTSIKHADLGTFSMRTNVYASQKDKTKLFKWLRKEGYKDMIKPTVNSKSLNALFSEIITNGTIPENIGVDVFLKSAISNTK